MFLEISRVKFFLSLTCLHSQMCIRIYIFNFKKQTNKQKKQEYKKEKESKEEKRISLENWLKKLICSRPCEDFSCYPLFWKQEYFFSPQSQLPRITDSYDPNSKNKLTENIPSLSYCIFPHYHFRSSLILRQFVNEEIWEL